MITVSKSASSLIRKRVEIQEINRDKVLSGLSPAAEQIDEKANVCKPRNIEENEAEGAVATLHTASVNNGVMENDNAVLKLFNNIAGSTAKNPSEPKNGTHISRYPGPIDSLYKFQIAWKSSDNNLNGRRQILEVNSS